jgi:hypothetical protein
VRRKRRKRGEETIKVQGKVAGKDVEVFLPIKNIPIILFLIVLGAPGILVGRPADVADMRSAWFINLSSDRAPIPLGFESFASPVMDTFKFCQFLAKIAHGFAVDSLSDGFTPLLTDVVLSKARTARYDLVGGVPTSSPPSENLHELSLEWEHHGGVDYAIVKIRLFANLGAPTYVVVAGTA